MMANRIRRLAVLTSGGDSPGANACIRAVVRTALHYDIEPWGVREGFQGLLNGEMMPLSSRSVSHIINRGGTFLGSSRCEEFRAKNAWREALRHLNEQAIGALIVIGGDGSMRGARALSDAGYPVMGVPSTIENDVCGTEAAVGVDTALNTALDALDRVKDTASAHEQAFLVEVGGHKSGYLALMAGIAGGAEMVCIPERPFLLEEIAQGVADAYVRGKKHCIIIVAGGAKPSATEIAAYLMSREEETGFDVRITGLGHIQRGGSPLAYDRMLATRFGAAAVQGLREDKEGMLVGLSDGEIIYSPLAEVAECTRGIDESYYEMALALAL